MNIFTFIGDILHLASIFILLVKIVSAQNCEGISLKTQALYALVFITRYLDLFWNWHSLYNVFMKIIFITSSCYIVYLMKWKQPICSRYNKGADNFRAIFLIVPCFILALFINEMFTISEILWTFSIYLEAVAIVPQLVVVHKHAQKQNGTVENLTSHYVFCLGGYRAMYLVNWVYRALTETGYSNWIVWIPGVIQTLIYCDFFYFYIKARLEGRSMALPI